MAEGRAKRLGAAGLNFAGNFYDLTSGMSLLDALSAGTKGSERGGKCDEEQEREQQKQKQKEEKEL